MLKFHALQSFFTFLFLLPLNLQIKVNNSYCEIFLVLYQMFKGNIMQVILAQNIIRFFESETYHIPYLLLLKFKDGSSTYGENLNHLIYSNTACNTFFYKRRYFPYRVTQPITTGYCQTPNTGETVGCLYFDMVTRINITLRNSVEIMRKC